MIVCHITPSEVIGALVAAPWPAACGNPMLPAAMKAIAGAGALKLMIHEFLFVVQVRNEVGELAESLVTMRQWPSLESEKAISRARWRCRRP